MSALGLRVASEAERLLGTPFRLHGRDPVSGLDCIGLVALCLSRARDGQPVPAPTGYRMRNCDPARHLAFAGQAGLTEVSDSPHRAGDVIHVSPGPAQDHLLIALADRRYIHAHAGLRRVVATPGPLDGVLRHQWRAL